MQQIVVEAEVERQEILIQIEDSIAMEQQANNPLHGIKLVQILEELVDFYGWEHLGFKIRINCFNSNPTIKSSLKFLRRTPWARTKVEDLYLKMITKR